MPLKRILCKPLVHFLWLGVGILLAGSLIAQRTSTEPELTFVMLCLVMLSTPAFALSILFLV